MASSSDAGFIRPGECLVRCPVRFGVHELSQGWRGSSSMENRRILAPLEWGSLRSNSNSTSHPLKHLTWRSAGQSSLLRRCGQCMQTAVFG